MRAFKTLPSKYYLQHFHEFINFVQGPCLHLLSEQDKDFVKQFLNLHEDTQCTYVRALNRKPAVLSKASLDYEEISGHQQHIDTLLKNGFLLNIEQQHLPQLFAHLTKAQLLEQLQLAQIQARQSASKQHIVALAEQHLTYQTVAATGLLDDYILRGKQRHIDYFLFLFFGNLNSSLNKFSMRDMGIIKTQQGVSSDNARFDFIEQSQSAFFYADLRRKAVSAPDSELINLAVALESFPTPHGTVANYHKDKAFYLLGKRLLSQQHPLALHVLSQSAEPQAQEKVIREHYKRGEKDIVKTALEAIIEEPENDEILSFAEDFLARKFNQKRTSVLTDMLRENRRVLNIDEIYRNNVEQGVRAFYAKQGALAFHTENRLWRALFGLVFWDELFENDSRAIVTEFDHSPQSLVQNCFYQKYTNAIEARLQQSHNTGLMFKHVSQNLLKHYARPNSVFRWHDGLLEQLKLFFEQAPSLAIEEILRAMAKNFRGLNDGFPDLMILDNDGIRFEEIKAPGDQLRKNQLQTIKQLRQAGFQVDVTQVQWFLDPQQPYVVVDIETTGGRAGHHRITEIAMIRVIDNHIVDHWQSLINPQRHIPANITHLTGIDNNMVADAPLFVEVAEQIRDFLTGSIFVAHNVNFDYSFIRQEFARLEQHFSMPKLCTVREMRKAVPGLPSYSLANLACHFEITMTQHHRAASDALATVKLLQIINQHRHAQKNKNSP